MQSQYLFPLDFIYLFLCFREMLVGANRTFVEPSLETLKKGIQEINRKTDLPQNTGCRGTCRCYITTKP